MRFATFSALATSLLLAACGDDSTTAGGGGEGGGAGGGGGGRGGGGGGDVTLPELEEGWTELAPGGDTLCSRGTDYAFWVRKGTTNKVVIDFIGGGACWNDLTCSVAGAIFEEDVESVRQAVESGEGAGIYDDTNEANPFKDYYHVIIPYCTGDIHWGNNDVTYGEGEGAFTIHHRGAVNARAVLDWVYESFSAPEEILVTGCSAGSYGSALWSAHVMEHYPESKVFQLGDSGAGIITQTFFEESFPSWNAEEAFPTWIPALDPENVNILEMALTDLYLGVANYYPNQRFSQFNTAFDENQTFYFEVMGGSGPEEWSQLMHASVAEIEAGAENFGSFIAPDFKHCIIPYDEFYSVSVGETSLIEWITASQAGPGIESVKCEGAACGAPAGALTLAAPHFAQATTQRKPFSLQLERHERSFCLQPRAQVIEP
ncbi:MAG: pectinesterase [Polyangiaceae bacterium]|nr:pectinesterase [Polyangiaceae bacterium]